MCGVNLWLSWKQGEEDEDEEDEHEEDEDRV